MKEERTFKVERGIVKTTDIVDRTFLGIKIGTKNVYGLADGYHATLNIGDGVELVKSIASSDIPDYIDAGLYLHEQLLSEHTFNTIKQEIKQKYLPQY